MKIELSPQKIVKGCTTVWTEHTPDVDIKMALTDLTFKPQSIEAIYSFHVLEHLFIEEAEAAIKNWLEVLKPGGEIYVVVTDFQWVARSHVGGDIDITEVNKFFSSPTNFTQELLTEKMSEAGFIDMKIWSADVPDLFKVKDYELVIYGKRK